MTTQYSHIPLDFEQALARAVPTEQRDTFVELMIGDCRQTLQDLHSESVHLVVTDPPYFLDGLNMEWKKGRGGKRGTGSVGGLPVGMKFDRKQGMELEKFIYPVGESLLRILKPGGFALFFSQPRLSHRMSVGIEDSGFDIRDIYAWHFVNRAQSKAFKMDHFIDRKDMRDTEKRQLKRRLRGRKTPQLRPQYESIILAQKPREGTFVENYLRHEVGLVDVGASLDGKTASTVMSVEKTFKSKYNGHLTVKPVRLIEHLIRLFSEPGHVVLDPFVGSGTTAIAAQRTGRACIGIDIEPEYIAIAKKRLNAEDSNGRN